MAKAKSKEEIKESLNTSKEDLKAAKTELKEFEKSNKLAKGEDHSADEKLGKKWSKLNLVVEKKTKEVEDLRAELEAAKPEPKVRESKYEYPADCTSAADKKKFRTAQRAAKAKAEKDAAKGETKSDKKSKKDKTSKKKVETEEADDEGED